MLTSLDKAKVLVEALPYLKSFDRRFMVIKIGGSTMTSPDELRSLVTDVVFLEQVGVWPILVHGGGPAISAEMEKAGLKPHFIQGRRVTDARVLEIAHKVLIDRISSNVVELIEAAGGKGVPLNGRGSSFLKCEKRLEDGLDLGFVGEVTEVDVELARRIGSGGVIPVVAPVAHDTAGQLYNINADSVAWKIAANFKAEKLIFLSNVPGILRDKDDPATLISTCSAEQCRELAKQGVIGGGMLPKIEACIKALEGGCHSSHIVSGLLQHALLLEVFTPEGVGTKISILGGK
ncbi:MAG: acetylglutamate kinase [Planctomycetota bacterium]|nr:acetylglutamate kinase [Planctomycetota bacterium]